MRRILALAWLLLPLFAAFPSSIEAQDPSFRVTEIAWLAGHWGSNRAMGQEEWWTAPAGGVMLGVHREARPGDRTSFEFFRIAETPDGLVYFASPGGASPVPFTAIEVGPRRAVFENFLHDYPQHIVYEISAGSDTLTASIEGPDGDGGRRTISWTWLRVKDGSF